MKRKKRLTEIQYGYEKGMCKGEKWDDMKCGAHKTSGTRQHILPHNDVVEMTAWIYVHFLFLHFEDTTNQDLTLCHTLGHEGTLWWMNGWYNSTRWERQAPDCESGLAERTTQSLAFKI